MPVGTVTRCDFEGCGAVKRAGNHWWILRIHGREAHVIPLPAALPPSQSGDMVLCGEDHVTKKLSAWMGAQARQGG